MSEPESVDPYQPPASDVAGGSSRSPAIRGDRARALLGFLSTSGSFSRGELLIATVILVAIGMLLSTLHRLLPGILTLPMLKLLRYGLYGVWGIALGKRSRDLGTTFTYGMIVGLLFPVIGLVFLFQEGAKERAKKNSPARPSEP